MVEFFSLDVGRFEVGDGGWISCEFAGEARRACKRNERISKCDGENLCVWIDVGVSLRYICTHLYV